MTRLPSRNARTRWSKLGAGFLIAECAAGGVAMLSGAGAERDASALALACAGTLPTLLLATAVTAAALAAGVVAGRIAAGLVRLYDGALLFFVELAAALPSAALLPAAWTGGKGSFVVVLAVLAAIESIWVARLVRGELLSLDEEQRVLELASADQHGRGPRLGVWRAVMAPLPVAGALVFAEVCVLDAALAVSGLGSVADAPTWGRALGSALAGLRAVHFAPVALAGLSTLAVHAVLRGLAEQLASRLRTPRGVARGSPWPSSQ